MQKFLEPPGDAGRMLWVHGDGGQNVAVLVKLDALDFKPDEIHPRHSYSVTYLGAVVEAMFG